MHGDKRRYINKKFKYIYKYTFDDLWFLFFGLDCDTVCGDFEKKCVP